LVAVAADGEAEVAGAAAAGLAVQAVLGPEAACRGPRHLLAVRHRSAAARDHREASLGRLAAVHPVLPVALAPAALAQGSAAALGRLAAQAAVWRIVPRLLDSLPDRVQARLISVGPAELAKVRESVNCPAARAPESAAAIALARALESISYLQPGPVVPAARASAAAPVPVVVLAELVKAPALANFPRIGQAAASAR
jgi:hypothetical protein